mmetsp:Transcript_50959/g.134810  ORF Transcript_50959/g.134810 Transcript_50959/m.134810 type:complete len:261 (-) Transcript_50959:120-902(-)
MCCGVRSAAGSAQISAVTILFWGKVVLMVVLLGYETVASVSDKIEDASVRMWREITAAVAAAAVVGGGRSRSSLLMGDAAGSGVAADQPKRQEWPSAAFSLSPATAAAAALALGYAAIAAFEAELPAPPSRSARPPCTRPLAPGDAAFGLCHAPLACVRRVVAPLLACKQRRSPLRRPARCPSFGAGGVGAGGGGGWRRRVTWEARAGSRLPDRPVARTVRRTSRGAGLARRGNCAQGGGRVGGGTDELQGGAAGAVRCG